VFTTVLAPDGALTGKAVSAIAARAAGRCGVQASAHRLRHTAASDLLRADPSPLSSAGRNRSSPAMNNMPKTEPSKPPAATAW